MEPVSIYRVQPRTPLKLTLVPDAIEVMSGLVEGAYSVIHRGLKLKTSGSTLREVHYLRVGFYSFEAAGCYLNCYLNTTLANSLDDGSLTGLNPKLIFVEQRHHPPPKQVTQDWELWVDHP